MTQSTWRDDYTERDERPLSTWFTRDVGSGRRRAQIHPVIETTKDWLADRTVMDEARRRQVQEIVVMSWGRLDRALLSRAMPPVTRWIVRPRPQALDSLGLGHPAQHLDEARIAERIPERAFVFAGAEIALQKKAHAGETQLVRDPEQTGKARIAQQAGTCGVVGAERIEQRLLDEILGDERPPIAGSQLARERRLAGTRQAGHENDSDVRHDLNCTCIRKPSTLS